MRAKRRIRLCRTKARGFYGSDTEDFDVQLGTDPISQRQAWTWAPAAECHQGAARDKRDQRREQLRERLMAGNFTEREAREQLGIPRATYFRLKKECVSG